MNASRGAVRSPFRGQADQWSSDIGKRIAAHDQTLGGHTAVREPAGDELEDAGGGFGQALDEPDDGRTRAQGRSEEDR
jgi:hypothetical protein